MGPTPDRKRRDPHFGAPQTEMRGGKSPRTDCSRSEWVGQEGDSPSKIPRANGQANRPDRTLPRSAALRPEAGPISVT